MGFVNESNLVKNTMQLSYDLLSFKNESHDRFMANIERLRKEQKKDIQALKNLGMMI
jgi:hypothetical protein